MDNTRIDQPAATAVTLAQAEEPCRKAESQQNLKLGAMVTAFSSAVLLDYFVPPPSTEGPNGVCLTVSLLLALATFLCGNALMLSSLPRHLISGGQRVAGSCLAVGCVSLSTLTTLSLLWAFPCNPYQYVGLVVAVVVVPPVVSLMKWYRRHSNEATAYKERNEDLEDASKTASGVTVIEAGGLLAAVSGASDLSGTSPEIDGDPSAPGRSI